MNLPWPRGVGLAQRDRRFAVELEVAGQATGEPAGELFPSEAIARHISPSQLGVASF